MAYALGDNRLLPLLLVVEFDLVLCACLYLLGAVLLAQGLDLGDIENGGLAKEPEDEVVPDEDDTLLFLLDLLSELGEEGEVDGGVCLVRLDEMHGLVSLESEFHLQVEDLLILLLCLR